MSTGLWLLLGLGWTAFAVVLTVRLLWPVGGRRTSQHARDAQHVMAHWQPPSDGTR